MERIPNLFNSKCSTITFGRKWTIANFSRLYHENHPWKWEISPDKISPPNNEQFKFKLYLYPKDKVESAKDFVSIGVGVYDMPPIYEGKIDSRWNVSIEDKNGKKCKTNEMTSYLTYGNHGETTLNFMKYSELLNSSSKYLPNDQLTLLFEIHLKADDRIFNMTTNNLAGHSRFDCSAKVTRVVHTWTIDNFLQLFDVGKVAPLFHQSDYFSLLDKPSERFCIKLYPNGANAESKDNVDVIISHEFKTNVTIHGKISILDVDGEECQTSEGTRKFEPNFGMLHEYDRAYLLDNDNAFLHEDKLKLHCDMSYMLDSTKSNELVNYTQMSDSEFKSVSNIDVTKKAVHYAKYEWTIDKFRALCLNSTADHSIKSKNFYPATSKHNKFHLSLWPNGYKEDSKKYLALDVCNVSKFQVIAQNRLSILNANGEKWTKWGDQATIIEHGIIQNSKFLSQFCVQDPAFIQQYLPNDKLTILFELWVIQDRKVHKLKTVNRASMLNNVTGTTNVNMSKANLTNSIVNVQGNVSINDMAVSVNSSTGKNSTENNAVNGVMPAAEAKQVAQANNVEDNDSSDATSNKAPNSP